MNVATVREPSLQTQMKTGVLVESWMCCFNLVSVLVEVVLGSSGVIGFSRVNMVLDFHFVFLVGWFD